MAVRLYGIDPIACERVLVATFDTEEQAYEYVKSAELKKPREHACGCCKTQYKQRSLLWRFEDCVVEKPPYIPHNPRPLRRKPKVT